VNILFVHEVDWLRKVVFDMHSLSESLSLLGHKVYAIDYESMWTRENAWDFGGLGTRDFSQVSRARQGASVYLIRPGLIKIPGLSRLSAAFTQYTAIKRTIEEKHIDVVVLYGVPTNGLQTVHLARKFNIPVVFRSIDILHQLVRYSALRPLTKSLEKKVYSQVDMILTLTPKLSRYVIDNGARESRVKLLLMPVDTDLFRPSSDYKEVRDQWGLSPEHQVIVFIGTLFEFSGLDVLIRQFPKVLDSIPEARLLIVGDGPQRSQLEGIITKLGLSQQVIITGFQPYITMPQYLNLAAICINPFLITDATRDIFPGKIVQYLACGKAVIASPLLGMTAVITGEDQGVVYATANNMTEAIITLLKSPQQSQKLGQNGLKYVVSTHSYDRIARQLEANLEDAIKEKQHGRISEKI